MIGIIGALPREVDGLKKAMENVKVTKVSSIEFCSGTLCGVDVVVAEAGMGKVNAAVTAQTMILKYKPEFIVNIGVAGGLIKSLGVGDIAIADRTAEHDMDATALGDELGYITGLNRVYMDCDRELVELLRECTKKMGINTIVGTIVSGDQFIDSDDQRKRLTEVFNGVAAEMEGAAIGHVCAMNDVPFGVLRAISDGADSDSHMDYWTFCNMAANNSIKIIKGLLTRMGQKDSCRG